ncbi:hypothetical protein [Pseudoalteromonas phenolica]|uniref:hypothetical protein n=1 Tax=Pseudoalteromonas phenolica TaxID=161398 RepID=UPI00110B88A3|nr:hypothetical protein [Pseudoalteromonas phenolica]
MGCIFTSLSLGLHFDTVILIGMFLAALLNIFFYVSNISKNVSLLVTSIVMASSYFTSNHFIDLSGSTKNIYISWIGYDLLTISLILIIHKIFTQKTCTAARYVIVGLSLNALLCLFLHIDLRVLENRDPWWFWYFYTLAINTIDVIMVAALILDRDFLGAKIIKNRVRNYFSKRHKTISA